MREDNAFSRHITFSSLKSGYERLQTLLADLQKESEPLLIGFEATGHYWLTLFQKLKQDGYTVSVLNPLQVQSFRNQKIRGSKTDDDDCELIAKVLKFGVGRETTLPEENLFKLKQLSRFRTDTVGQISKRKLRVMAVLDIVFPEYQTVFFDLFGMTSTKVLSEYTTADVIADMDLEKLTAVLEEASRKRVSRKRAEKLQETARNTFGLKYGIDAFSLELKCMIRQVEHLREQKMLVEKEIQKLVEQADTKLLTIPGVSYVTAGAVLGEMVDFHKKDSSDPRSLLAFAGLDPRHRQSGASRGTSIMGKRGSPYLRNAIWNAALASLSADPMFRQIYDKQKSLGKHHLVCLSHVAKKLTYVIFSVLKTGRPYYSVPEKTEA